MEQKKTDFSATSSLGPPLMQRMSNYTQGFGTYDESYTIEDEQERFLGECGALISETVGTGDPHELPRSKSGCSTKTTSSAP